MITVAGLSSDDRTIQISSGCSAEVVLAVPSTATSGATAGDGRLGWPAEAGIDGILGMAGTAGPVVAMALTGAVEVAGFPAAL